jgi:hypothetical protein
MIVSMVRLFLNVMMKTQDTITEVTLYEHYQVPGSYTHFVIFRVVPFGKYDYV